MASDKKQGHLEAGKRRLEEFRKKKAADRAKKSGNNASNNATEHNNQTEIHADSNGELISDGVSEAVIEPSQILNEESRTTVNSEVLSSDIPPNPSYSTFSTEIADTPIENKDIDKYDRSWSSRIGSTNFSSSPYVKNDGSNASGGLSQVTKDLDGNQYSYEHLNTTSSKATDYYSTEFKFPTPAISNHTLPDAPQGNSGNIQMPNNYSYGSLLDGGLTLSSNEDSVHSSTKFGASFPEDRRNNHEILETNYSPITSVGERKLNDYFGNLPVSNSTTFWPKESQSTASTTGLSSSSYSPLHQTVSEANNRRSRSSFLDSINLSKVEPDNLVSFSSKARDNNVLSSSMFENSLTENQRFNHSMVSMGSLGSLGDGNDTCKGVANNGTMEKDSFFNSRKHDDDFAALEQHIEDLTQEKYSLQRALEASRSLADSLAAENSSLTDSYNQQGSIVNQLKYDMEMLQEEIKAHMVELESVRMEYGNAQLECTAADERVKLLASEVITLEEKVLRLRSSELKLERQLENSEAEVSSLRRKLSSLEKDRQDLQSTINALQEEKKLLQAKLRKTSTSEKSIDAGKTLYNKKDVSTSTEDLVNEEEIDAAAGPSNLLNDNELLPENGQFNLEFASSRIPSDQLRMIQNINTLISELALEKEELTQALLIESSESSKLKELNKELSRKLEVQTQRLELLTAQSMANENIPYRQPDPRNMMIDNTPYADEGDEVVERVLGWIMKLFPGGPSRRRNSKPI